VYSVYSVVV